MPVRATDVIFLSISSLLLPGYLHAAPALVADYQLQDVYTSSVGTAGPLTVVGNQDNINFSGNVDVNGHDQTVLTITQNYFANFDGGAGVQTQTSGYLSASNYSVALTADFDISSDVIATKLLDFKNLSSDDGLYVNDVTGVLDFNGVPTAIGGTPLVSGTYSNIVLTRDGSTNEVTVYQDGTEAFAFDDSSGLAVLGDSTAPSTNAYLTVFKDDATGLGSSVVDEDTLGDLAHLQLYDGPLTAAQVTSLNSSGSVPEPTGGVLTLLGAGLALRRSRRSKSL